MFRLLVPLLAVTLLAASLAADGQPAEKHPRIGILRPGSPPDPLVEAFRQGFASSATTKGGTSRSSIGGPRDGTSGFRGSRPTSFASIST
jgi:hypothetical protein